MYGHKYVSKKEKWVSNNCGGTVLKRTYKYDDSNKKVMRLFGKIITYGIVKLILKSKERRLNKNK